MHILSTYDIYTITLLKFHDTITDKLIDRIEKTFADLACIARNVFLLGNIF